MQVAWAAYHAFASKRPSFKSKDWILPFKKMEELLKEEAAIPNYPKGEGPRRLTKEDIMKINKALSQARKKGEI